MLQRGILEWIKWNINGNANGSIELKNELSFINKKMKKSSSCLLFPMHFKFKEQFIIVSQVFNTQIFVYFKFFRQFR